MLDHKRILLFDFETTGLYPDKEQIIEIGAVLMEKQDGKYVEIDSFDQLLIADKPLSPKIIEITHITDEMLLRDGIEQEVACQKFMAMMEGEPLLIAYNIQFDLSFLHFFIRRYFNQNYVVTNDILDVMAIYKDRHKFPHRLDQAVETYQANVKNTHRAIDDIRATFDVLVNMNEELPNIKKYVNVIGYNKKYGVSGIRLPHVKYVAQYGGQKEIERL
ncbi:MAG: 3'-5' exonuclease [Acholeplasmataceae bacterium]